MYVSADGASPAIYPGLSSLSVLQWVIGEGFAGCLVPGVGLAAPVYAAKEPGGCLPEDEICGER